MSAARAGVVHCDRAKKPGESIEIGDLLSSGIEPSIVIGRVIGFIKRDENGNECCQVLYRRYRSQEEAWPSGNVYSRRFPMVWAHQHFPGSSCTRQLEAVE